MKKVYTLGPDGRLSPEDIDAVLPSQSGNTGKVLESDGTQVDWGSKLANKGFAFEVSSAQFSSGYVVLPSLPEDVSSIRVYVVGGVPQISEDMASMLPSYLPDFAYRFEGGEPRLYFRNVAPVSGLSEAPVNLFETGIAYIVYYDTGL